MFIPLDFMFHCENVSELQSEIEMKIVRHEYAKFSELWWILVALYQQGLFQLLMRPIANAFSINIHWSISTHPVLSLSPPFVSGKQLILWI